MTQPLPATGTGDAIWDLVIADMKERDKTGERRYGKRLQANNGRDVLRDAYEEALDLAVYLRQEIEQRRLAKVARLRERIEDLAQELNRTDPQ